MGSGSRACSLGAITVCLAFVAGAHAQPRYSVTVIGGLGHQPASGPISSSLGLNNNGRVVGYGYTGVTQIQALSWRNGSLASLGGVFAFDLTFANDVNSLGRIVGSGCYTDSSGGVVASRAVKWTGGVMSDLGSLGGQISGALAINDSEQIVGFSSTAGEERTRAFIHQHGKMTAIDTLPGEIESYAYDISNTGFVVGAAVTSAPAKPFLWRSGSARPLYIPAEARAGAASAVNDSGLAVGTYEINQFTGSFAAVLWQSGRMVELGNLGGALAYASAADVNNGGEVVGTSNSPDGFTGFLWYSGRMFDLRDLLVPGTSGVVITAANSINDNGQIAATALVNGRQTAVLLTPVAGIPGPSVLTSLSAGGYLATRRRRRVTPPRV